MYTINECCLAILNDSTCFSPYMRINVGVGKRTIFSNNNGTFSVMKHLSDTFVGVKVNSAYLLKYFLILEI